MDRVELIEAIGRGMESVGVAIIVLGAAIATIRFLRRWRGGSQPEANYRDYRRGIGKSILLGLEFLVAGDIIRTVAVEPTFRTVGVLAIIVAIRTFLSLELQLEIEGRWPWQQAASDQPPASDATSLAASSEAAATWPDSATQPGRVAGTQRPSSDT